jgi:transposase InsO family protein
LRRPLESAQYACTDYIALLDHHGIQPSMSRIACPYDNAFAESFMKTLKQEEVDGRGYTDIDHARADIGTFIEVTYNGQRLHSALAYATPVEFESTPTAVPPEPRKGACRC